MAHWTAQQRYRQAKRDPYRAAQIAPSHPLPAVVCARPGCGHARLVHEFVEQCLVPGCDCTEYLPTESGEGT